KKSIHTLQNILSSFKNHYFFKYLPPNSKLRSTSVRILSQLSKKIKTPKITTFVLFLKNFRYKI
ncbi:hypothetical protein ACIJDF_002849, partial [Enterococcus hirae]